MGKLYVPYYRVSTADQGKSGLGLEAQRRDVELFLANFAEEGAQIAESFTDIQSGGDNDRPALNAALDLVRRTPGAELLIAKLDRLSRRVSFIATLMDDPKVKLRVAAMPHADKFQLHVYAALAEQEREFISLRTKAALASAKARGSKLGGLRPGTEERNAARVAAADARALKAGPMLQALRRDGLTMAQIAERMNNAGLTSARGGPWHPSAVHRTLARMDKEAPEAATA